MKKVLKAALCPLFASIALPAWGVDLTIPNTFTAGTAAVASQVNDNFTATATAVNSKQDKASAAGVEFINDVSNVAITTSDTTVASIDVAVPTAGFLIATAMGSASCSSATTLTVRLHNATTAASSPLTTFENRPVAIQNLTMLYFVHYVFAVSAGSNIVTVTGNCSIGSGAMNANTLSAIFVPTRY